MMPWWVLLIFVLGVNFALWGTVGLVRLAESLAGRRRGPARRALASTAKRGNDDGRHGRGRAGRPGWARARGPSAQYR